MDFPKKQQQCLIPKYLLDYLGEANELYPDVSDLITEDEVDTKLEDYELKADAFSGDYNDLTNKPTIPTKTSELTNDSGYITSEAIPTNYVTTDTDQNITGEKTFVGQKKIKFKQYTPSSKLGFTLYDDSTNEKGYLEYNPSDNGLFLGRYGNYGVTELGFLSQFGTNVEKHKVLVPNTYRRGNTSDYLVTSINNTRADASGNVTLSIPDISNYYNKDEVNSLISDVVTTDTAQNITGVKTFVGSKRIKFKQSESTDRPGFTIYDNYNQEKAYFEYVPTDDGLYLGRYGNYRVNELGFKTSVTGGTHKLLIPNVTLSGNVTDYIPISVNNTKADSSGNISIAIPDVSNYYTKNEVDSLIPTVPTNVSAFTNDAGYITGITDTMINTALGYTAADAADVPTTATSTSTVTPTNIQLTFTYSDNTTETITLMTGASVSTNTTLS